MATWQCLWRCSSSVVSRLYSSRSLRENIVMMTVMTMMIMMTYKRRLSLIIECDMRITWALMRQLMDDRREVRNQSGEWFQKQLQYRLGTRAVGDADHRSNGSIMASESSQVREFIERLVESLVAGGLDHVNVNRLYLHPDYDRMFSTYHGALCDVLARLSFALQMAIANKPLDESDSPSAAHAELKQLVSSIIREAMTLPAMQQGLTKSSANCNNKTPQDDINSKTYEDILATAILNKVIERFQQCGTASATDDNSNLLYKSSDMECQPKFVSRVDIGCSSGRTSSCSVDEAGGLSSWSETSQAEPHSLTLEECIEEEEEVTTYSSEEGEEIETSTGAELDFYLSGLNFIKRHRVPFPEFGMDLVDGRDERDEGEDGGSPQPTDLLSPEDSWEDNWLFQRRRLKVGGVHHPMPVPMLVPNPSEDYRALIGDRDAEETSDLSECSDGIYDDILEMELVQQMMRDAPLTEDVADLAEARNDELANSIDSSSEYGQQDSEYTEDYASATRRQMNSLTRGHDHGHDHDVTVTSPPTPTPRPRTMPMTDSSFDGSSDTRETSLDDLSVTDLATPPRPGIIQSDDERCMSPAWSGTIAEREHRKWESAVPLENNPYSSENILKRLNKSAVLDMRPTSCQLDTPEQPGYQPKPDKTAESTQTDVSRYGRDYYVNASKTAAGCIGKNYMRPVEIVMSPRLTDLGTEVIGEKNEEETVSPHVGTEVTRLQKEINQKEQLWLKTINSNKTETDSKIGETNSDIHKCGKSYDIDAPTVVVRRLQKPKLENSTCRNLKNGLLNVESKQNTKQDISKQKNSYIAGSKKTDDISKSAPPSNCNIAFIKQTDVYHDMPSTNGNVVLCKRVDNNNKCGPVMNGSIVTSKQHESNIVICNKVDGNVSGSNRDVKLIVNGGSKKLSEGSSASSDSELTISMPSVKHLAKQFTERNSSPSKSPSTSPMCQSPVSKKHQLEMLNSPRQPMREIHSLTARSISRVFREELKHSNKPTASSDSSHSQRSSSDACYTSDEGSTSPTPGMLRNNIAFWEKLKTNN